jgi:hypothetical protein
MDRLTDDAALCAAELSTNAILHSRGPFTVSVRVIPDGIRIDVHDDRPDRLPVVVPSSLEPLDTGTTGRGLLLIAGLAQRWGYYTTDPAKTVWVELSGVLPGEPTEPVVELADHPATSLDVRVNVELPVRAAIASGIQVDELVRELQLAPDRLSEPERVMLHDLLERSAGPRLIGRQAAFRAAAAGRARYSLELATNRDELVAMGELRAFLDRLAAESNLDAREVTPEVAEMRSWLSAEMASQLAGNEPSAYPVA